MINQKEGETEMSVKIHYDNMVSDSAETRVRCLMFRFRGG